MNDDCLYNIFLYAVQVPFPIETFAGTPLDHRLVPPFNFSAICRTWRSVVASHPDLWSSIDIHQRTSPFHLSVLRFVKTWVKNSASAWLKISLSLSQREEDPHDPVSDELLSFISLQNERWHSFSLYTDFDIKRERGPLTVRCSRSLISVSLRSPGLPVVLDLSSAVKFNGTGAAQLKVLNIESWGMEWAFPKCRDALHLPNLRRLSFNADFSPDLGDSFALLSACPNITWLDIDSRERTSPTLEAETSHAILLPQLLEFSILSSYEIVSNHFLDSLICPSLKNCDLTSPSIGNPQNLHKITAFLRRDFVALPPLSELCIRYQTPNIVPPDCIPNARARCDIC